MEQEVEKIESCKDKDHYTNIIAFGMCPTCKHVFSLGQKHEQRTND